MRQSWLLAAVWCAVAVAVVMWAGPKHLSRKLHKQEEERGSRGARDSYAFWGRQARPRVNQRKTGNRMREEVRHFDPHLVVSGLPNTVTPGAGRRG